MLLNSHYPSMTTPSTAAAPVISVEGVSKKFCRDLRRSLFYGMQDIAADLTGGRRHSDRLRSQEFWALQDISFQLRPGEAVGLVGSNGAGKSTLLRIISGLIKPDVGRVKIRGRLAPLIALGAGFNPILTGRENIYANMSILGLTTRQIEQRFQDVVDFAEIEEAIDAPVQTYSSGMAARLGFACAIYTEPEILLIDEVLAVGDARFKAKCFRRLYELRQRGVAFILVNHNTQAILNVCTQAVYLSRGRLISSGTAEDIVYQYEKDLFLGTDDLQENCLVLSPKPPATSAGIDIRAIYFRNSQGEILQQLFTGEPATLCVACHAHHHQADVSLQVRIAPIGGEDNSTPVLCLNNQYDNVAFDVPQGDFELRLEMPYLSLAPGTYTSKIKIQKDLVYTFETIDFFRFSVESQQSMNRCRFYQPRQWSVVQVEPSAQKHPSLMTQP